MPGQPSLEVYDGQLHLLPDAVSEIAQKRIFFEKYSAITTSWIVVPKLVGSKSGNAHRGEEIFGFLQRIRSHLQSRQREDP